MFKKHSQILLGIEKGEIKKNFNFHEKPNLHHIPNIYIYVTFDIKLASHLIT